MDYLPTDQLAALDMAAEAAPPAPWSFNYDADDTRDDLYMSYWLQDAADETQADIYVRETAVYVAAADPGTVRALIAEVLARRAWDRKVVSLMRERGDSEVEWFAGQVGTEWYDLANECPTIPNEAQP